MTSGVLHDDKPEISCCRSQPAPYLFTPAQLHVPRIQEVVGAFSANHRREGHLNVVNSLTMDSARCWKMELVNDACRGASVWPWLTCKCPWYILSAQRSRISPSADAQTCSGLAEPTVGPRTGDMERSLRSCPLPGC